MCDVLMVASPDSYRIGVKLNSQFKLNLFCIIPVFSFIIEAMKFYLFDYFLV